MAVTAPGPPQVWIHTARSSPGSGPDGRHLDAGRSRISAVAFANSDCARPPNRFASNGRELVSRPSRRAASKFFIMRCKAIDCWSCRRSRWMIRWLRSAVFRDQNSMQTARLHDAGPVLAGPNNAAYHPTARITRRDPVSGCRCPIRPTIGDSIEPGGRPAEFLRSSTGASTANRSRASSGACRFTSFPMARVRRRSWS